MSLAYEFCTCSSGLMPVGYCSSLIWTWCASYFMPWSCLEWDIGNWRLCAWFQCMQPYMLWWLCCFTKDRSWRWIRGCGRFHQTQYCYCWERLLRSHVDRRWWREANSFGLIIIQVLRDSANDNLIAKTVCFVFNSLFYGEPVYLHQKRFGVFCSTRFKDEFGFWVLYLFEWFDDCLGQ